MKNAIQVSGSAMTALIPRTPGTSSCRFPPSRSEAEQGGPPLHYGVFRAVMAPPL
jgi:hypothetical protein